MLAINHHVRATGDVAWLRAIYPSVARAADYILAQVDDRGLVFCSARDERGNVWAIAGWRNVIAGYTLNGAVTEINAECAAALRAAGHLAELADDRVGADRYATGGRSIASAMDAHLINPENGLYYLNIDADGVVHTDVTGDELFPVVFRVCSEETGYRVIRRLNASDFWTSAGLRTISQHDPLYDPSGNVGLLGGVCLGSRGGTPSPQRAIIRNLWSRRFARRSSTTLRIRARTIRCPGSSASTSTAKASSTEECV